MVGRRLLMTFPQQQQPRFLGQPNGLGQQQSLTDHSRNQHAIVLLPTKARFPFKRNRLRCVRCVNENRKKRKRLRWQAANHGCHRFDRAFLLAGACVCCVKNRKRLRFLRFSFTRRTQRKRLRLNGNRA